jgi:phosphoribosylformylglycinamidine synthase subunit PurL
VTPHGFWFGEDQSRYVLAVSDSGKLLRAAEAAGIPARRIGTAGGGGLTLPGGDAISLDTLRETHERFFPEWMRS